MQSVTCVNDSECWAVGGSAIGAVGSRALIESYNGNRWALASGPGISSAPGGVLFGASCATAGDCWAVGTGGGTSDGGRRLLVEHYTCCLRPSEWCGPQRATRVSQSSTTGPAGQ
jgi:hypothetical protein